jgi:2-dehydropantoate 2-reductase
MVRRNAGCQIEGRIPSIRALGAAGYAEPRALIDAMSAAAPGQIPALLAVRP